MSDELEAQRRLKIAVLERVQGLEGTDQLAYAPIGTGFDIIAGQHRPAELTLADRAKRRRHAADALGDDDARGPAGVAPPRGGGRGRHSGPGAGRSRAHAAGLLRKTARM